MTPQPDGAGSHQPTTVAVIGGGITGLAAAHRLISSSPDVQVTLVESSSRLGGIIRTEEADGFLMELGPDSFITSKPAVLQLCEEIGFADQLIPTDSRFRRSLVLRQGRPLPVPDGFTLMAPSRPWAIATTPILSVRGRLRLLAERFVPRRTTTDDESLAAFVRRRFGHEALERLVQPLIGGIYTSDPEKLSLQATLPRFPEMEQQYGSVIKGTLAGRRASSSTDAAAQSSSDSGARYSLFMTAAQGLGQLVEALVAKLCESNQLTIRRKAKVESIRQTAAADGSPRWQVALQNLPPLPQFDAVIVTLPAWQAASMLQGESLDPLCSELRGIEYASSAVVVSGHQLQDFQHPLDAFGLVIPAIEQREILAVSFTSRKFPQRAPDGHVLLRTFLGGAMQPELLERDDDELAATVNRELTSLLGMHREPLFSEVVRYEKAMPQYHVGHLDRVSRIDGLAARQEGLFLAGNAYRGVGIPDSIASGRAAADQTLQHTRSASAGQVADG